MYKLSAVIITYNEERNIARCLDSLAGIADDIVVLDSFSTDKTEEICKQKGARFFQHKFDGHIQQKNRVITFAQFPHIISLDADEALSEELKRSILEVKKNWTHDGYYINRMTNYCGQWIKHSGWYPDKKLRLWDSSKGEWRGTNPHDKYELFEGDKATSRLKGDILHYSFYTIDEHVRQVDYFSTIAAKARFEKGEKTNFLLLSNALQIKFTKHYFIKLGFLDGFYGFVIAMISGYSAFLKHAKLRELWRNKK
jgi:glycosyltransferase involved in cell wall biosynthesis